MRTRNLWMGLLLALVVATPLQAQQDPYLPESGRPPGFGPELDRTAISLLEGFQRYLNDQLGFVPGNPPSARGGLLHRNTFGLGNWRLSDPLRREFAAWRLKLITTPGMGARTAPMISSWSSS